MNPFEEEDEFDELLALDDAARLEEALPVPDEPVPVEPVPVPPLPAVTSSPTAPEIDAIVPAVGAYSFVPESAVSSVLTVSSSPETAACAEAMFAWSVAWVIAESVELDVPVVLVVPLEVFGFVVLELLVAPVAPLDEVVPLALVAPLAPVLPLAPVGPNAAAAFASEAADPLLPPVEDAPEGFASVSASFACAASRLACAYSSATVAEVGSIVASSSPAATCCPALTYRFVKMPLDLKLRSYSLTGARLPLADSDACTTPRSTVT